MQNQSILFSCLFCLVLPFLSGCSLPTQWQAQENVWEQYLPVSDASFSPDFPLVSLTKTNRDLDVAIIGEGFLQVLDPFTNELYYSRLGYLTVDPNGQIVHWSEGYDVNGEPTFYSRRLNPPILIPDDTERIQIYDDGSVWVTLKGKNQQRQIVGIIELAVFSNPEGLEQVEKNLFRETGASGWAVSHTPGVSVAGHLRTGYLENWNDAPYLR